MDGEVSIDTLLLDKRSHEVQERLVLEHGSRGSAEVWLAKPNGFPPLHGMTPDMYFADHGEGWYLDLSCNVRVEATGAFAPIR